MCYFPLSFLPPTCPVNVKPSSAIMCPIIYNWLFLELRISDIFVPIISICRHCSNAPSMLFSSYFSGTIFMLPQVTSQSNIDNKQEFSHLFFIFNEFLLFLYPVFNFWKASFTVRLRISLSNFPDTSSVITISRYLICLTCLILILGCLICYHQNILSFYS